LTRHSCGLTLFTIYSRFTQCACACFAFAYSFNALYFCNDVCVCVCVCVCEREREKRESGEGLKSTSVVCSLTQHTKRQSSRNPGQQEFPHASRVHSDAVSMETVAASTMCGRP